MPRDKIGHFYYSWFPTIYQPDTQHLTLAEDGAYRRLIDCYMLTRSPLPSDDRALARIVGVGIDEWNSIKTQPLSYFKPDGLLLRHTFCDETLTADAERIKTSRKNGAQGGRPTGSKLKRKTQQVPKPKPEGKPPGSPNPTLNNPDSEAKASSAEAPSVDFKRVLFNEGLAFLSQASGKPADKLRPIIGKWCKDFGDERTAIAIMDAQKFQAVEPISYITKRLKGQGHASQNDNRSPAKRAADYAAEIIALRGSGMADEADSGGEVGPERFDDTPEPALCHSEILRREG